MAIKIIRLLAIVGIFVISALVNTQTTTVSQQIPAPMQPANQTKPQGSQSLFWMKVKEFNFDIQAMRAANNIDSQKLIKDIEEIVSTAKASSMNIPPQVPTQMKDLENIVQLMTDSGKSFPHQILTIIAGVKEEIVQEINLSRSKNATNA